MKWEINIPSDKSGAIESDSDNLIVDMWYPDRQRRRSIEIGLIDVRAASNIRVTYDFHRDGWVIEQVMIHQWEIGDTIQDEGWTEVAFIQS